MTAVGFEPTPLRTGAWSQRLRPLGQTVVGAGCVGLAPWLLCVCCFHGGGKQASCGIRTRDLPLTERVLCQLRDRQWAALALRRAGFERVCLLDVAVAHLGLYHLVAAWLWLFYIVFAFVCNPVGACWRPVAQWIRHRPTEPGIAGSSPAGVIVACW